MSPSETFERALDQLGGTVPERKRSVVIAGHGTSVSVEPIFWDELRAVADARGISMNGLVGEIDRDRDGSLSSAIRVFALAQVRATA